MTQQIVHATGVSLEELVSPLLALAQTRVAVLLKRPNCKKVERTDAWTINSKYGTAKHADVAATTTSVTVVPFELTGRAPVDGDTKEAEGAAARRLKLFTDQAILVEMKTRREMSHSNLYTAVENVVQARRLLLTHQDFARSIEELLSQNYLERITVTVAEKSPPTPTSPPPTEPPSGTFHLDLSTPALTVAGYRYLV